MFISSIVQNLDTLMFLPETFIVSQGEQGDLFFIISQGQSEVSVTDYKHDQYLVRTLEPGDFFGEVSLITGQRRSATVKAKNY